MRYLILLSVLLGIFSCGSDDDENNSLKKSSSSVEAGPQVIIVRESADGTMSYATLDQEYRSERELQAAVDSGSVQFQRFSRARVVDDVNGYPRNPRNQDIMFVEDLTDFVVNEDELSARSRRSSRSFDGNGYYNSYYNTGYFNNGYYYDSYYANYLYGCGANVGYYGYNNYCGNYGGYNFNHYYPYYNNNFYNNYSNFYWQPTYYYNNSWYYYNTGYNPWYSNGYNYYHYYWMWSI